MALAARNRGVWLLAILVFAPLLDGWGRAATPASGATRVTIEIRRGPGLEPERYTLACEPPSGTLPDPALACRRIAALVERGTSPWVSSGLRVRWLFGSMVFCPPVYGGPEVMTVRGSLAGQPVDGRFTREDGCTMSAYDRMERMFGVPTPGDEDAPSL